MRHFLRACSPFHLVVLCALACKGDTEAPAAATTLAAVSGTTIQATAGAAVTEKPTVSVKDQRGNAMAGVAVSFAVTAGGGSVSGPSVTTGADGNAQVGGWTLGTLAGPNTLTASAASLTAVIFTATGVAGPPASITKTAGDAQIAVAGAAVAVPPAVTLKDANGNPVSGATVTFAVSAGAGTITGGTAISNSSGIATVGSWTLGDPGANSLSATVPNIAAATFTATASFAISMSKTAGDAQSTLAGDPVASPSVTVIKSSVPLANAIVTFTPAANSGTVTGGTQTTGTNGAATVDRWRLGPIGTSTLNVTTPGSAPVAFTATALNPCEWAYAITLGKTVNWDLHSLDCKSTTSNRLFDTWAITLQAGAYQLEMKSSAVNPYLELYTNVSPTHYLAGNEDSSATVKNASIRAILPAGNYSMFTFGGAGESGAYSTSISTTSEATTNCALVFVTFGTATNQSVQTTDCRDPHFSQTYYLDQFGIWLKAGETVKINMASNAVDAYLLLVNGKAEVLSENDDKDQSSNDSELVFKATADAWHYIWASTSGIEETGAYSLTITKQ